MVSKSLDDQIENVHYEGVTFSVHKTVYLKFCFAEAKRGYVYRKWMPMLWQVHYNKTYYLKPYSTLIYPCETNGQNENYIFRYIKSLVGSE